MTIKADQITVEKIQSYLTMAGWSHLKKINGLLEIWSKIDSPDHLEVAVPTANSARDFKLRAYQLIEDLSLIENRSQELISRSINAALMDIIKIRVQHDDVRSGFIPIDDGVLLIEKAKELLASATLSTIDKKKYFPSGSRPKIATQFLDKVMLGQTEIGSYVVNLLAPLAVVSSEQKNQEDFEPTSFTRLVTKTLSTSLKALQENLDQPESFVNEKCREEIVQKGISSNLCDALIGISGSNENRNFTISINFSGQEAIGEKEGVASYSFDSSAITSIKEISQYLKDNYTIENFPVSGHIEKLHRDYGSETGDISVLTKFGEKDKSVSIPLSKNDYELAIAAHKSEEVVTCIGSLYVTPRTLTLINYRNFQVLRSGHLF